MKKNWGKLASINLYHCDTKKLRNKKCMREYLKILCKNIDMEPHGKPYVERFGDGTLEGISAMQFIETSSITIHCDEIEDRIFIDIFSCKDFDAEKALRCSKKYFNSKKEKMWVKLRS